MSLNRVYVIPHGDEILDLPNEESRKMHDAIEKVTVGDDSETVVIISPHGLRLGNHVSVLNTEFFSGYYRRDILPQLTQGASRFKDRSCHWQSSNLHGREFGSAPPYSDQSSIPDVHCGIQVPINGQAAWVALVYAV